MKTVAVSVRVERADEAQAEAIASILLRAFVEYRPLYTREGFAATITSVRGVTERIREGPVFIAVHEERLLGTASAVLQDAAVYVRGMAVIPEARGQGIGRLLLGSIESLARGGQARRLLLSTTPFLTQAIRMYQDAGFQRTDEGPDDLFGTPLFTMEKSLVDG